MMKKGWRMWQRPNGSPIPFLQSPGRVPGRVGPQLVCANPYRFECLQWSRTRKRCADLAVSDRCTCGLHFVTDLDEFLSTMIQWSERVPDRHHSAVYGHVSAVGKSLPDRNREFHDTAFRSAEIYIHHLLVAPSSENLCRPLAEIYGCPVEVMVDDRLANCAEQFVVVSRLHEEGVDR